MALDIETYNNIRKGGAGFIEMPRGLIAVWGKEAVQFLDGMITNDMKTLEDGQQMLAAFPNAQGRLLAVVRVLRQGDKFYFETEATTREKLFQNLFRFTYAGDFFVEDQTESHRYVELFGGETVPPVSSDGLTFTARSSAGHFVLSDEADAFKQALEDSGFLNIPDDLYETLRIENGVPKYGVDMDETTIIPELGFDEMISYTKGCYVGQEIIARIHFRGHVAKRLTGLILDGDFGLSADAGETPAVQSLELTTPEGKNAGRITSTTYSPGLDKHIALAYVRYDYLADGTELISGDISATVSTPPFIQPL